MTPIDKVLAALQGVRKAGEGWQAKCPAHDDQHASLCIDEGRDGRALLKCQAGCKYTAVVAAAGLEVTDLFARAAQAPRPRESRLVDTYTYCDSDGTALFEVHRFEPKAFLQKLPGAQNYGGLNGTKRVPYRLLELSLTDADRAVFVVEGEKDVHRLMELGLIATCNPGGAGKWRDEYSGYLTGRTVYVLADNDQPGADHAEQVARSLWGKAREIRVVALPGLPPKGDVCDWLDGGRSAEDLKHVVATVPTWVLVEEAPKTNFQPIERPVGSEVGGLLEMTGAELASADLNLENLPYLPILGQEGFAVEGWSHLLAAYPRAGKTELLVRCVQSWIAAGHRVLYITEEPPPIWQYRLSAHPELATDRLTVVFGLGHDPVALYKRAMTGLEDILIVDTLRNLLRPEDEKDNSQVALLVNPWVAGARAVNKTLWMVSHERKGGGDNGEGMAGGHALLGCFDIAIELLFDPHHSNRRLLKTHPRLISQKEMVYEQDGLGRLLALGDPADLGLSEVRDRCLAELSAEPQTTREVHAALGEPKPSPEQVRLALKDLAHQAKILRDPPIAVGEAQGKTHRWLLPATANLTSNGQSHGLEVKLEATALPI